MADSSGVGDRPLLAPSRTRCLGMYAGGEGDDVRRTGGSVGSSSGGDDKPWVVEMFSGASGSESLRFLLEDVVKVKALFPYGNKAPRQKGVKERGRKRICGTQ